MKIIKLTKNTILSIILITVSTITLEICARLDDAIKYGAPLLTKYTPEILRTTDNDGIIKNRPNVRYEKWFNNIEGFRVKPVDTNKQLANVRIACMGTSETYGLYEDEGYEWPSQLKNFYKYNEKIEIFNTSVVGLPFDKYIPYIEKYIIPYKPNIVILLINPFQYITSLERSFQNYEKKIKIKNDIVVTDNEIFDKWKYINKFIDCLQLRVVPKIKQNIMKLLPQKIYNYLQNKRINIMINTLEKSKLKGKTPKDIVPEEFVYAYRKELEKLIEFLKDKGVIPILCSYPVLISEQNLEEQWNIFLAFRRFSIEFSVKGLLDISNKINLATEYIAIKNSVIFFDLNSALENNIKYFSDNVHYTNEGASIIAEFLYNFLYSTFPKIGYSKIDKIE